VTDEGDGGYTVTYEATRVGRYTLQLVLGDVVWQAPQPVTLVAAAASAARSFIVERREGAGSTFSVQTMDQWGNACTQVKREPLHVDVQYTPLQVGGAWTERSELGVGLSVALEPTPPLSRPHQTLTPLSTNARTLRDTLLPLQVLKSAGVKKKKKVSLARTLLKVTDAGDGRWEAAWQVKLTWRAPARYADASGVVLTRTAGACAGDVRGQRHPGRRARARQSVRNDAHAGGGVCGGVRAGGAAARVPSPRGG
jgi:hypothetical protein